MLGQARGEMEDAKKVWFIGLFLALLWGFGDIAFLPGYQQCYRDGMKLEKHDFKRTGLTLPLSLVHPGFIHLFNAFKPPRTKWFGGVFLGQSRHLTLLGWDGAPI